ncbi:MAG: HD domain-containing protein [Patescibacteria group bacterium]
MDILKNLDHKIPKEVSHVTQTLEKGGFEAYLVGGCVRDLLMSREPNDWDITTNAKPEEIVRLFEKTVYENTFGTVAVCVPLVASAEKGIPVEGSAKEGIPIVSHVTLLSEADKQTDDVTHETSSESVSHVTLEENNPLNRDKYLIVEVTPYRTETDYTDSRHPDNIKFAETLEEDLKRRDFTINAMSYIKGHITDMFDGIKDIDNKTLRTVGDADERFSEDALRILRAVRFSTQLDFSISSDTTESILKNADSIKKISPERIREEFVKIIMSDNASAGIVLLQKFNLLKNIIPELEEGIGCMQSGEHVYDVWNHLLYGLQHAVDKKWQKEVRLAALFHDIGKPRSRREESRVGKKQYTFYGHEVVSARMTKKIMERLKFPRKEIELVEKLVRNHMFFSDTEQITLSAVRRIIAKIGKENIWLLMNLRECDRVGTNKKETSYRLRKYHAMIEEALRDPISVGQLKINGEYLMKELQINPGPRMGWILNALLEEVLDDPTKNTVENLSEITLSLNKLNDKELKALGDSAKEKKEELEEKEVAKLHQKHGVRK